MLQLGQGLSGRAEKEENSPGVLDQGRRRLLLKSGMYTAHTTMYKIWINDEIDAMTLEGGKDRKGELGFYTIPQWRASELRASCSEPKDAPLVLRLGIMTSSWRGKDWNSDGNCNYTRFLNRSRI